MNDYKELVTECEEWIAKADNFGADDLANHISRCANAIEQLVKESDEWRGMYFEKRNKTAAKHLGENDTQVLL